MRFPPRGVSGPWGGPYGGQVKPKRGTSINMSTLPHRSRRRVGAYTPFALSERQSAALMCVVAATLAVMSFLHLSAVLAGGTKPFDRSDAGVAEAVICLALGYGGAGLLRRRAHAQTVALAATGFAIVGFIVGLQFTLSGGDAVDIAYHLGALPILLITLIALLRIRPRGTRPPLLPARAKRRAGS